eukprot:CAMPEP_0171642794 /NCGR_PEP_ID=MMETSP0990-20121206/32219_1 /TAXON_ID=483369 /ORGANISM="non described non described, Strain CCMP2098" /LENGTH=120 /DNA_ID=CAMNT_0012218187 /DNA_START=374 /DNA_END=736 /DNA_ORIENTATION=+
MWPVVKPQVHRSKAVALVRAEAQSVLLRRLLLSAWPITSDERGLLRRGRNAAGRGPPRLSGGAYGEASALETLIGYLYFSDRGRMQELLDFLQVLSDGEAQEGEDAVVDWQAGSEDDEED